LDIKEFNVDTSGASANPTTATSIAMSAATAVAKSAGAPAGNIFAELNKGGDITSGLKTVTKDMQTWRKEYKSDAAPAAPMPAKKPIPAPRAGEQVKGLPKVEYQAHGAKWQVENQSEVCVFRYILAPMKYRTLRFIQCRRVA